MAESIKIKQGDTLSELAQTHGTTVSDFQEANPNIKDPNLIRAGESLNLPTQTKSFSDDVVDAERMANEQPLTIPQIQEPAGERAMEEVMAENRRTSERLAQQQVQESEQKTDESRSQLQQRVSEALGLQQERIQAEEEAGLTEMNQELAEITSQIEARELSARRRIEEIQDASNMSKTQGDRMIREVQRETARELADLSIVQNAKSRNIEATQTAIDRRINLEMEGLEFQLQFDKMFYEENRQSLTQAEDREFQTLMQREERQYQEQLQKKQEVGEIVKEAALMGANQSQISQIAQSRNKLEAIVASGSVLGRGFEMERQAQEFDQQMARESLALQRYQIESNIRARAESALMAQMEELEAEEEERSSATEKALSMKTLAEELKDHKGLSGAVGKGFKKTIVGSIPFVSGEAGAGTARANFEAQAQRLSDLLTLDNLNMMSGVLTDKDIEILANAGSMLGNFDISEKQYEKEIERILETADRTIKKEGLSEEQSEFWFDMSESDIQDIQSIYGNESELSTEFNPKDFY